MKTSTFETQGFERVDKAIKSLAFPLEFFDSVFSKYARQTTRDIVINTPKKTGALSKKWTTPSKKGPSHYQIDAIYLTQDKKHNIMTLVDQGRGVVRPIKAKRLYIPLSEKGMSKPLGANIPKNFKYGVDYVLAKKAKPTKPAKFIKPVVEKMAKQLIDDMIEVYNRKVLAF